MNRNRFIWRWMLVGVVLWGWGTPAHATQWGRTTPGLVQDEMRIGFGLQSSSFDGWLTVPGVNTYWRGLWIDDVVALWELGLDANSTLQVQAGIGIITMGPSDTAVGLQAGLGYMHRINRTPQLLQGWVQSLGGENLEVGVVGSFRTGDGSSGTTYAWFYEVNLGASASAQFGNLLGYAQLHYVSVWGGEESLTSAYYATFASATPVGVVLGAEIPLGDGRNLSGELRLISEFSLGLTYKLPF